MSVVDDRALLVIILALVIIYSLAIFYLMVAMGGVKKKL